MPAWQLSELRTAVRKEQKDRYEHMLMWLAAPTGSELALLRFNGAPSSRCAVRA
jgi:hypothetical protein